MSVPIPSLTSSSAAALSDYGNNFNIQNFNSPEDPMLGVARLINAVSGPSVTGKAPANNLFPVSFGESSHRYKPLNTGSVVDDKGGFPILLIGLAGVAAIFLLRKRG